MTESERMIIAGAMPAEFWDKSTDESISGLAAAIEAVRTKNPNLGKNATIAAIIAAARKEVGASPERLQVIDRLPQLAKVDEQEVRALLDGKKQLVNTVLYSTEHTLGGSTVNLIKSDGQQAHGTRSFAAQVHTEHFLIQKFALLYSSAGTITGGNFLQALPADIVCADLKITIDSNVLFNYLPISSFYSSAANIDGHINRFKLDTPKWLFKNKKIEAAIEAAGTTTTGFVKILFFGQEIRPF